ncbi:MAG: SBBP repeat-containing protein, partial [Bacteroidota bacterium]
MNKLIITFLVYTFGLSKLLAEPPKLHFIENKGQWSEEFIFKKPLGNGQVYFEKNKLSFFLADFGSLSHPPHSGDAHYKPEHVNVDGPASYDYYSFTFLGSEEPECVEGKGRRLTKVNYLRGDKPDNWFGNVATYESVLYGDIYSGIDAVFSQYNNYLKYDFHVAPNSCPEQIMLGYENVGNMHINEGRLIVNTEVGYVQELKPYAYQIIEGEIIAIPCEYVLKDNMVHFQFPEGYETNVELVIDPILIFSTYSGSTYDNWGNTATFDSLGNLYSGGMVTTARGMDFPITSGAYQETFGGGTWDAAILKYDSAGQELLYATYLGGAGNEIPQSLVVDSEGDLLILGTTSSVDFPITNGSTFKGGTSIEPIGGVDFNGTDIFVTKLSEDGSELLASTYLGGTGNDGVNFISGKLNDPDTDKEESPLARNYGDQLRGDVFTDSKNDVYIASNTLSSDFLIADNILNTFQGGSLDAALVKLSGDLSVLWSRFIGGSGADAAYSIKVNSVDEVVISGGTNSNDISDMNTGWQNSNAGNIDGWIKKFSSDGSVLIEGTYLGTAAYDQSYFIDIDSEDNIYTFGQTQGVFPITGSVYTEVNGGQFLQKYSSDLTQLLLSTTFGSGGNTPDISPTAFLVNECNNIYFAGWGGATNIARISSSVSRNFVGGDTFGLRTSEDAIDRITSGNDFYLMVLSGDAQDFLYGTFFGGEASNTHVDGGTSRFDKNGIVYHSVCAGCGGLESDFPATPGAYSEINNSSNCNNAAFKFDLASLRARFNTNSITFDNSGISSICLGDVFILENQSIGGELFEWDFDDGSPIISRTDTTFIQHIYQ